MRSTRFMSCLTSLILLGSFGCTRPSAEPEPQAEPAVSSIASQASAAVADSSTKDGKPIKPLALGVPAAPASDANGQDLSKADGGRLEAMAARFASEGNPREAARYQYWSVQSGAGGEYNLACWTALAGDVNGAFYWLQEAALNDGVDVNWAGQDSDIESLRRDPRWQKIVPYLKSCNAYWAANAPHRTLLVLPEGYKKGTPIGVLIGMHGMGDQPDGYADPETYQEIANELNRAFVGVSGTVATGPRKFLWSEDPAKDAQRIRQALDEVSDRLTVKPGSLIAFGFSQGGQMAFEVAFQNPGDYLGAIVMSPGTSNSFFRLAKLQPADSNKKQGYVCVCGAGEHPGNVALTRNDAQFAEKAGARVELKLYEGMNRHAFPPDFLESFVARVRFIEGSASEGK